MSNVIQLFKNNVIQLFPKKKPEPITQAYTPNKEFANSDLADLLNKTHNVERWLMGYNVNGKQHYIVFLRHNEYAIDLYVKTYRDITEYKVESHGHSPYSTIVLKNILRFIA